MSDPTDNPEGNDETGSTVPNTATGAGIGASTDPNTFEAEDDPEAVDDPSE